MTADTPRSATVGGDDAGGADTGGARRRIGLFGGTFDPVHHGHLAAASMVCQVLDFDQVWLVVANDPWQKRGERIITPASTRLRWVEMAVAPVERLVACDVEIETGGPSYTIDTVELLRRRHPGVDWSVVVGADVASQLDTWHRAEELRTMVDVVAVNRPGASLADVTPGWRVSEVVIPPVDLAATTLREFAAQGRGLHYFVPTDVADDILASGIYRSRSGVG